MVDTSSLTKRIAFLSVHGCPFARLGARDTGGMNVYVRQLAASLGRTGYSVDIFTRDHGCKHQHIISLNENTRVIHIKAGPNDAPKEDLFSYLPDFVSGLRRFQSQNGLKYDLIHSHYWLSGWVGMGLARAWGVPHVTTFHTLSEIKSRARVGEQEAGPRSDTERRIAAAVDRVVVSTAHEHGALRSFYQAPKDRVTVVPAGVDLTLFQPGDQQLARDQLGLNGHHTLLYVGRMEPIKGLDVLLHTIAYLETPRPVQLLVVGGNGDHDQRLDEAKALVDSLEIQDRVEFLGSLDQQQLPSYYQAADVCVVPSYYESFGLVALEAMACGTPVVASRVPGLQAIVSDNRSGYLVPWHCPDAFADRLEVLLANDALRTSMGKEARNVAQELSWDRTSSAVAKVYAGLGVTPGSSNHPS